MKCKSLGFLLVLVFFLSACDGEKLPGSKVDSSAIAPAHSESEKEQARRGIMGSGKEPRPVRGEQIKGL